MTKPITRTCEICYKLLYVIQGVKNIFDKVANFLASADIRVALFAMLLLIGLALFYTQGVFVYIEFYLCMWCDFLMGYVEPGTFNL